MSWSPLRLSFTLSFLILSQAACSTMSSQKDKDAVGQIRTAAVVAFIDKKEASNALALNANTGGLGAMAGGSSFYQKSKQTDALYSTFVKALSKPTGWKMKGLYDVGNHPLYVEQHKKIMPAIQITQLPPAGQNWFLAGELMTPDALEALGTDGRNKLAAALGVDAVISAEVVTTAKSNWYFMGMGPRKPQGEVRFKVFARGRPEPVWNEWIQGEKSTESAGFTGFMDENAVRELGETSLQTAFRRIGTDPEATE